YESGYNPSISKEIIFEDRIETLFGNQKSEERGERLTLKKLQQQRKVLQYRIDQQRFRNYPTLTLGGYYGINYFDNDFDPFKDQNLHGNSYVKVGLTMPLTDWLMHGKNSRIARQQYEANEFIYQNEQNKLALNRYTAQKDAESSY